MEALIKDELVYHKGTKGGEVEKDYEDRKG